jgi:hypothetical protein
MIRFLFPSRRQLSLVLCLGLLLGCGGGPPRPVAPVSGKVTFNGEPLPTGTLIFMPQAGGPPATGAIGNDGSYKLTTFSDDDGAVPGTHTVMISALKENGDFSPQTELLPQKFGTEKSGLTAEIKADENNVVDFKLEGVLFKPRRETPAMP